MMHLYKKITLCLTLGITTLIYTTTNNEENIKFPAYPNHEFNYRIKTTVRPMKEDEIPLHNPIIMEDSITKIDPFGFSESPASTSLKQWKPMKTSVSENWFNSGITRTKTTEFTHNNQIISTTETWTTKSPTYFTLRNLALLTAYSLLLHNSSKNSIIPYLPAMIAIYSKNTPLFTEKKAGSRIHKKSYTFDEAKQHQIISEQQAEVLKNKYQDSYKNLTIYKITAQYLNKPIINFIAKTLDGIPVE
ncbi:MAG: hypothetical protein ACXWL2_02810 [Candidatus Chromulinivorax sp.]